MRTTRPAMPRVHDDAQRRAASMRAALSFAADAIKEARDAQFLTEAEFPAAVRGIVSAARVATGFARRALYGLHR